MAINFAAKMAVTAVMMVAQVAIGAMRKIEGPRLDDKKPTLAEYNAPLRYFWGAVRLDGCPIPWAEDLKEKKKKTKTKGGKYAEYKYYGTFMAVIADHEIDAVRRIWLDDRLIYQVAGVGPIAALISSAIDPAAQGAEVKLNANNLSTYLGTETQLPDARMEAWYEDHPDFGPNSCPAHRGTAYLLFKDIPLEKFGNRIPQVSVEAVRSKEITYPYEQFTSEQTISGEWAFGGGWVAYYGSQGIEWWDAASRTRLGFSMDPNGFLPQTLALTESGTAYGMGTYIDVGNPAHLMICEPMSVPLLVHAPTAESLFYEITRVFGGTPYTAYQDTPGFLLGSVHADHAQVARDFCEDSFGDIWVLYQPSGASDEFTLENTADGGATWTWTGSTSRSGVSHARVCYNAWGNFFVLGGDGYFYIISRDDGSIVDSGAESWTDDQVQLPAQSPGSRSFWVQFSEYSLEDGSEIRALSSFDWVFVNAASVGYDPVLHAHWMRQTASSNIYVLYLDRIDGAGVTLGEIVEDVGGLVGCTISAGALDQNVPGYSHTPGPAKDIIAPLLDIHQSILRPNDFTIRGVKRSTTSLGTIPVSEFIREGNSKPYSLEIAQDTEIPLELTVNFADNTKDYQQNNVISTRASDAVDSERRQQINLGSYCEAPTPMQQMSDRFLRWWWNSKAKVNNGLTANYLTLEPGDVWTLDLDGEEWDCEAQKVTIAATTPKLNVEWKRTFPALANLGSQLGPDMDGTDNDAIFAPGPTKGFVLDIPFTNDNEAEANPLLHYAAGSYGTGIWPGAAILDGGLDGEDYDEWNAVASTDKAIWGQATSALGNANHCQWDRGNTLSVRIFGGTLSNSTEAAINADPTINQFALSIMVDGVRTWEIANFTTATLTGSTSTYREYDLSGFLRGRRGTEWAVSEHAIGDDFVLVSSMDADSVGLSEVGNTLYYKAQTYGRDPEMAPEIIIPFVAQSLKPYAPVIDSIEKLANGDIEIVIRTRTRVGGAWNGSTIPTGETIAQYEFDVMDGEDVVRTLESTDKTFLYTAAAQTEDFASELEADELEGLAYQLSATVGRGFARAA